MLNLERLDRLIDTIGTKLGQRIDGDPAAAGEAAGKFIATLGEGGGRAKRTWSSMLGLGGGGPSLVDAAGQGRSGGPSLLDSLGLRGGGPSLLGATGVPQASWRERPSLLGTLGGGIAQDGRVSLIGAIAPKVPKTPPTTATTDYPGASSGGQYGNHEQYRALIEKYARAKGIDPDALAGILQIETDGNPTRVSHSGAQGLGQFMPATWAAYGDGGDPFNPDDAIRAAANYYGYLYRKFGDYSVAAAAYQSGEGNIINGRPRTDIDDGNLTPQQYADLWTQKYRAIKSSAPPQTAPSGGGNLVAAARSLVGTPYVLGGLRATGDPRKGLDCSEFTAWVYQQAGVKLPWNAQAQFNATQRVGAGQLQAGDLVFFHSTNPADPDYVTHVGMYIGNGQMINSQDGGVMTADLGNEYWRTRVAGYGRVKR